MTKLTQLIAKTYKPITFEAGALARASNGSCRVSLGDSSVLVTAVSKKPSKPAGLGFVPFTVFYKEESAAAGRIPTTHLKRDIGFTEKDVLTSRMIDRSIRPSFPKAFYEDTQVVCSLLAVDGNNNPDVLAINGASASLAVSDIPWQGPIGAVRMGLLGENPVPFPTRKELANSRVNLVLTANADGNIIMIDGSCSEPVMIQDVAKTIKRGVRECKAIIDTISNLQSKVGKQKREIDLTFMPSTEMKEFTLSFGALKVLDVLQNSSYDKRRRDDALFQIRNELFEKLREKFPDADNITLEENFSRLVGYLHRKSVISKKIRCDGRNLTQIRLMSAEVNLHEPLHGSALFQRGQTQVFCTCTFDSLDAAFPTDYITLITTGVKEKNFMLHYEFPQFAVGDIGKLTNMPDRRELGHGALAEKALRPVLPEESEYTTQLKCKVLDSNGSSSMASVCAGTMALLDAGVKIKDPVAGVAMGLLTEPFDNSVPAAEFDKFKNAVLLTDIIGFEDYFGDMDFKIAGTKKAITALQLDVKLAEGLPPIVVYNALAKSQPARTAILEKMKTAIKEPREGKKDCHPVTKTFHVPAHKVSKFIGFGGYNLKKMLRQLGIKISEFTLDDASTNGPEVDNFMIFAPNKDAMLEAEEYIEKLLAQETSEPKLEFGGIYTATILEIKDQGLMIRFYPAMRPVLLPLREVDIRAVKSISVLEFEVGQQIQVKYFGTDPVSGHMRISRRAIQMSSAPRSQDLSLFGTAQ